MASNQKDFNWVEDFRKEHLKKSSRNPGLAALMSFILMGLGQIYAGHIDRGIILMFFHLCSLVSAYSLYTGGFLYKWLISIIGPHFIIAITYVFSVVFILTWIYNIKDAYYLSIFSSFRDWFEVERILLPSMGVPADKLISNSSINLLENFSEVKNPDKVVESVDYSDKNSEEVINVTPVKDYSNREEVKNMDNDYNDDSTVNLVYMNSNSWKVYWVSILLVIAVGLGIGFYLKNSKEIPSFQVEKSFEFYSKKEINKSNENKSEKVVTDQAQTETKENIATEKDSKTDNQNLQTAIVPAKENNNNQNVNNNNITQEQIEAYVDKRIQTLLALNQRKSMQNEMMAYNTSNVQQPNIYNPNMFISGNMNYQNNQKQIETFSDTRKDNSDNQVVFIQGHKEATVLNKTPSLEMDSKSSGVVLYQAANNADDDVQLVITDDNEIPQIEEDEENIVTKPIITPTIPVQVENKPVVPNVNQQTIDQLKIEEKAEKARAEKKETELEKDTQEAKGKVLFEKIDDTDKKMAKADVAQKKPETLKPATSQKIEKASTTKINIESVELRNKLEKIKERGAYEFYQGNWEAALPFYFEVLKYRRNAESFEMVGIIFEKMNKLPDAFEAYENAYNLGMNNNHNVARLGLIAEKIGNYEKAQKYLEKAIENNPKRADIILSYARCLNELDESEAAAQVLAVLRDSTNSYAIKKAAEQEYQKITKQNSVNSENTAEKRVEEPIFSENKSE